METRIDVLEDGTGGLVERLQQALSKHGDFPASAKIVTELGKRLQDPRTTGSEIAEIILKEPSLGFRVLQVVNSALYRRSKVITTVSQAVAHMGLKAIAELCQGLILLQKFVPHNRQSGPFAMCLRRSAVTSLLSSSFSTVKSAQPTKGDEAAYLSGSFAEFGTLLLGFYFPQVFENAARRAEAKDISLEQSLQQIIGLTPLDLSNKLLEVLELPQFYTDVFQIARAFSTVAPLPAVAEENPQATETAKILCAARAVADAICLNRPRGDLTLELKKAAAYLDCEVERLVPVIAGLPSQFANYCVSLEVTLPLLPEYLPTYSFEEGVGIGGQLTEDAENQFDRYVAEIRQSVEDREPVASIMTTVMETFAWGLGFDRVLLLLLSSGRTSLVGRMGLGQLEDFDPSSLIRPLGNGASSHNPDAQAFLEGRPIFAGKPILPHGWPLAVIPIGFGARALGVIYADRIGESQRELTTQEQAAAGILAELLDRCVKNQG